MGGWGPELGLGAREIGTREVGTRDSILGGREAGFGKWGIWTGKPGFGIRDSVAVIDSDFGLTPVSRLPSTVSNLLPPDLYLTTSVS